MKRTAAQAGLPAGGPPTAAFKPTGAALLDPKAYFAQFQQAAANAPAAPSSVAPDVKNEVMEQVKAASAVKCASIIKEKGDNFTSMVAVEAFLTMATKSSFKLREELIRQPHVRKLCLRVRGLLTSPPTGFGLDILARIAWGITRMPDEIRGDTKAAFAPTVKYLQSQPASTWSPDSMSKVLWSLAKSDVIVPHKALFTSCVKEMIKDKGVKVKKISHEGLVDLLWAIARARQHKHEGDHRTVHMTAEDEELYSMASKRFQEDVDQIPMDKVCEIVYAHGDIGIRDEPLFNKLALRIVAKQKELREDQMAKVIRVYCRFMIPLKEPSQGFRTMAVVQKGDFIRPSEKPRHSGPRTYDHPVALYEKTQVHAR
mmetsp:Transcript_16099/g.41643  ORF Transcript_16099/g.41643 Transcript_16099/m.41643 type:complete len:371 (-) Transcript_16099:104-1216(-)